MVSGNILEPDDTSESSVDNENSSESDAFVGSNNTWLEEEEEKNCDAWKHLADLKSVNEKPVSTIQLLRYNELTDSK